MGLSFIGNPCEPEELGDSDIEIPDVEWITIPNTVTVDPLDSSEEVEGEELDSWSDTDDYDADYNPDDTDYNPDDENYEEQAELEDFMAYHSDCSFDIFSDDEYDDEDEIDYVTYSPLPMSSSNDIPPATNKTSEVTTSNQDDACVDAD